MRRWWLRWDRRERTWYLKEARSRVDLYGETKPSALIYVKWYAGHVIERFSGSVSLKICRKDGSVQEERTYPRSADPRGSRG